jgi:hypothetical protein
MRSQTYSPGHWGILLVLCNQTICLNISKLEYTTLRITMEKLKWLELCFCNSFILFDMYLQYVRKEFLKYKIAQL